MAFGEPCAGKPLARFDEGATGSIPALYSTCDVPEAETDPRKFGYSRDRRSDCVQVAIAMVVTSEGLPLAFG